jgi:SAM-dependent methyltransferase
MGPVMKSLKTLVRRLGHRVLLNPKVRILMEKLPFFRNRGGGVYRTHPFDQSYGVDTSSWFPRELIQTKDVTSDLINPYLGAEPSITRAAISVLPDITAHSFVDLGCGKGRAVIVASEFPFREIVGIELSLELARIAQSNVDKIQREFPGRPPIQIIPGNALDKLLTCGRVVVFMYHPFGRELMLELVNKIEASLLSSL